MDETFAVIGASSDPKKYGYKVFRDLFEAEYAAYPVNPKGGELLGAKVWPGVPELVSAGHAVDTAVFVVPPSVGLALLPALRDAGVKRFWFQPGSGSDEIREYCSTHGLECVMEACIMVERRRLDGESRISDHVC